MKAHQLINQTSGIVEYHSPPGLVATARKLMGGIDLDPASSFQANQYIGAERIFTSKEDGLKQQWHGRVWMNHPFGKSERACDSPCNKKICRERGYHLAQDKPGNEHWIGKLIGEYQEQRVTEACCITYASTSEAWFRSLLRFAQVFLIPRTNYYLPDGRIYKGVSKGSVITYLGPQVSRFATLFAPFGEVKLHYSYVLANLRDESA